MRIVLGYFSVRLGSLFAVAVLEQKKHPREIPWVFRFNCYEPKTQPLLAAAFSFADLALVVGLTFLLP